MKTQDWPIQENVFQIYIIHERGGGLSKPYASKAVKPYLNVKSYFCKNSGVRLRTMQLVMNWKECCLLFCSSFHLKIMIAIRVHTVKQSRTDAVHKITVIVFILCLFCGCHIAVPAFWRYVWAASEMLNGEGCEFICRPYHC